MVWTVRISYALVAGTAFYAFLHADTLGGLVGYGLFLIAYTVFAVWLLRTWANANETS